MGGGWGLKCLHLGKEMSFLLKEGTSVASSSVISHFKNGCSFSG